MKRTLKVIAVSFPSRTFKTDGKWIKVRIPNFDLVDLRNGKSYEFDISQDVEGNWIATEFWGERN